MYHQRGIPAASKDPWGRQVARNRAAITLPAVTTRFVGHLDPRHASGSTVHILLNGQLHSNAQMTFHSYSA